MSSKLRKLKQQAYEAGKKRDWSGAMSAYAEILEFDKNNPSLLNEYGDVCLKAGDASKAVRQFLAAASKYKTTGLLNNAQAVYKKVLRHDPDNLNANWFLAEVRASQGLMVEGEQHALRFLAAAEQVSGEIKDIFLKRCHELFELYPESEAVLEQLAQIFRVWDLPLDSARTNLLRACQLYRQGETEVAGNNVTELLAKHPELSNYKEYTRWQALSGAVAAVDPSVDVNSIQLDDAPIAPQPEPAAPAADEASFADVADDEAPDVPPADEASFADVVADESSFADVADVADVADEAAPAADEASFADVSVDQPTAPAAPESTGDLEQDSAFGSSFSDPDPAEVPDDDGCFAIDTEDAGDAGDAGGGFGSLMDDLVNEAAAAVSAAHESTDESEADDLGLGGSVNLLDEILAEEGEDILRSSDNEQLSTIASEIGRNLGDQQDADPEAQYQQGLVYLELGMHDQAILALETAARSGEHALQAREMWGIALQRAGQPEVALDVFQDGLTDVEPQNRLALGLRYHAGCILQDLERHDEAQEYFRQVHSVDAGFADVARRLRMQEV